MGSGWAPDPVLDPQAFWAGWVLAERMQEVLCPWKRSRPAGTAGILTAGCRAARDCLLFAAFQLQGLESFTLRANVWAGMVACMEGTA